MPDLTARPPFPAPPLETLLATWGISLILQQAVRTTFGAQNRQMTPRSMPMPTAPAAAKASGKAISNETWALTC